MRRAFLIGRCRFALLLTLALSGVPASALHADDSTVLDVLQRPAKQLKGASYSVQLAMARAGSRLVSVGEKGLILLSDDSGISWRQASAVPVSVTLTDIQFLDENRGFATGHSGVLLTTVDGGEHWQLKLDGNGIAEAYIRQAEALPDSDEKRHALKEAGYLVQDGADKPLLHLNFFDTRHGIVLGAYGLALKTTDGGKHWTPFSLEIPNDEGMHLYGSSSEDGETYLAGERGTLFIHNSSAPGFKQESSPYNGSYFGALAIGNGELLLYGLRGNLWHYSSMTGDWSQLGYPYDISITSAVETDDGSKILLGDANGNLVELIPSSPSKLVPLDNIGSYITDLVLVNGQVIASTVRGNKRIEVSL